MDRIERIDSHTGVAQPVTAVVRNARTDPDGSRRDHPPGEEQAPREHRPPEAPPADGLAHVDVQA
jgi:hypothetical protein